MTMERSPRAGMLGFSTIAGGVGGFVSFGQMLLGDSCRFSHVFPIVAPVGHPDWPDGLIQEAMPSGMRIRPLAPRLAPGYAFRDLGASDPMSTHSLAVAESFMPELAGHTAASPNVWNLRGPRYSFMSYLVLAEAQWALTRALTPDGLTRKYIDKSGRLICSQHADEFLHRLGLKVFNDGRWRGDVTPGDLWYARDPQIVRPAPVAVTGGETE